MKKIKLTSIIALIAIVLIAIGGSLYGNIAEYGEIGYTSAFFTDLTAKIGIYISVFMIFAVIFFVNLIFVRINLKQANEHYALDDRKGIAIFLTLLASLFCAFVIGSINYETVLMFFNKTPFGEYDAVFGKDVSFYVFELPFYKLIAEIFSLGFFFAIIYSAILYFLCSVKGNISAIKEKDKFITHLIVDALLFVAVKAFSLYLKGFEMLFGSFTSGLTGAGKTSVQFWKPFYTVAPFVLIIASAMLIFFIVKRSKKPFIMTLISVPAAFLIFSAVTLVFQVLYVNPQEVTAEAPYIENNIEATKKSIQY